MTRLNRPAAYISGLLVICMAAGFFSATLFGGQKRYEIRPEITLPEYKTEMDRVIEVYERMIDDHIKVMNDTMAELRGELKNVSKTLNTMEDSMSELSHQLETIQGRLGITVPEVKETPAVVPPASDIDDRHQ